MLAHFDESTFEGGARESVIVLIGYHLNAAQLEQVLNKVGEVACGRGMSWPHVTFPCLLEADFFARRSSPYSRGRLVSRGSRLTGCAPNVKMTLQKRK